MSKELPKNLFLQYAELKQKAKILEDEIAGVGKLILDEMSKQQLDKVRSDFGVFSIAKRKIWSYSENVAGAKQTVKDLETMEQQSGIAKFKESSILMFTSPKAEE